MSLNLGQSVAGLAIREHAVELVQLSKGLRGLTLVYAVRVPIGTAGSGAGSKPDPASLAKSGTRVTRVTEAVRSAVAGAKTRPRRVVVAVPPQDVLLRYFAIPAVPKSELDGAVQFEARKYIPFKMQELAWDYLVAPGGRGKGDRRLDVVVAAIERATLLGVQDWLRLADLECAVIEPQGFSLARAAALSYPELRGQFVALVETDGTAGFITVARDGVAYLTRQTHAATPSQAEGTVSSNPQLDQLLGELRLTTDFFAKEYGEAPIRRILLYGDGAFMQGWKATMAAQWPCPVDIARLPRLGAGQEQLSGAFATAFGAGSAGTRSGQRSLNFLRRAHAQRAATLAGQPLEFARWSQWLAAVHKPTVAVCVVVSALVLAAVWGIGARQVAQQRQAVAGAIDARPAVGWDLAGKSAAELEPLHQEAQRQLEILRGLLDGRGSVAAKLDALARQIPDGIWLTAMSYGDQRGNLRERHRVLTLQGACYLGQANDELAAIQAFGRALKDQTEFIEGFDSALLKQVSAEKAGAEAHPYRRFELQYESEQKL